MFLNILKCLSVNLIVAWGSAIMFVSPKLCLSNRSPGGAISEHKYIEIYKEKYKYNNKFRYRCKFFNDKSQIENKLWHSNRTPLVPRVNSMCDWLSKKFHKYGSVDNKSTPRQKVTQRSQGTGLGAGGLQMCPSDLECAGKWTTCAITFTTETLTSSIPLKRSSDNQH